MRREDERKDNRIVFWLILLMAGFCSSCAFTPFGEQMALWMNDDGQPKDYTPGGESGKTWRDPVTGMEFVWVPEGCFQMGSPVSETERFPGEGPVREVCVDGFYMGKNEVTNAQYRKYKPSHDSKSYGGYSLNGDDQPVVYVSWDDATAYADWLDRENDGRYTFRLPTEAEWEYAARAGTRTTRYWGDNPDDACRYANVHGRVSKWKFVTVKSHNCDDGYALTAPVGSFKANAFGLFDMLGNVWEWCADVRTRDAYEKQKSDNPYIKYGGPHQVLRGGSWRNFPRYVRSAHRYGDYPNVIAVWYGFRLIRKKRLFF